jgi:hypothetical protein
MRVAEAPPPPGRTGGGARPARIGPRAPLPAVLGCAGLPECDWKGSAVTKLFVVLLMGTVALAGCTKKAAYVYASPLFDPDPNAKAPPARDRGEGSDY